MTLEMGLLLNKFLFFVKIMTLKNHKIIIFYIFVPVGAVKCNKHEL